MVIARIAGYNGVEPLAVGLVRGDMNDLINGLKVGYLNTALEHFVTIVREVAVSERMKNFNIVGVYPSFPDEDEEEYVAEMNFPIVVVTVKLGSMRESGVGRVFTNSEDGVVKSFIQSIIVEFDCVGPDAKTVDAAVSFIGLISQMKKIDFVRKGFHNIKINHSNPALGWDAVLPWEYVQRWFRFKLLRHVIQLSTSFDVTWLEVPESAGIISQIVFDDETSLIFPMIFGVSNRYLIVEDQEFGMHGIYDEI